MEDTQRMIEAAQNGQWAVLASLILMVLIGAIRAVGSTALPKKYLPLLTAGIAMLASTAAALAVPGVVWWQALLAGLVIGTSASGFWSLLGKHLVTRVKRK